MWASKILLLGLCLSLTGCNFSAEKLGISKMSEGDSNAVGAACRQAKRSLEDCFVRNPKASAGQVHQGWIAMDEYIRENESLEFASEPPKVSQTEQVQGMPQSDFQPPSAESEGFKQYSDSVSPAAEVEPSVRPSRWTPASLQSRSAS